MARSAVDGRERVDAREVDGRLDLRRVPDVLRLDARRYAGGSRRAAERLCQAAVDQQRRIDVLRDRPDTIKGVVDVAAGRLEVPSCVRRAGELTGQLEVDGESDQILLDAVVEVALDLPALAVGYCH